MLLLLQYWSLEILRFCLLCVVQFISLEPVSATYIFVRFVTNALTKDSRVSKPLGGRIPKASCFWDAFDRRQRYGEPCQRCTI